MSQKELAGYAQQDAHEFFISALNNIHAGCEGHKLSNCDCIIHKTFAGLLQSNVTCLRCKNITTTCDPMLDISLGLKPPEKKKANRSLNGRRFSHDERSSKQGNTLKDCLERFLFFHLNLFSVLISMVTLGTHSLKNWGQMSIVAANAAIHFRKQLNNYQ
jgi:ubiquitin carboxyl-terminal hydrolase 22/27/51